MDVLRQFDEVQEILGAGALILAVLIGLTFGTRPWKLASLVMLFEYIGSLLLSQIDRYDRVLLSQSKSLIVACLLGWIVYRYRTSGIILLLALQLFALLLRVSVWAEPTILASVNGLVLNAVGWAMVLTLPTGALITRSAGRP